MKTLLEEWVPVGLISRDAAVEMSFKPIPAYMARCKELEITCNRRFYDPKIRNLHPWLARRPRSIARALNLAALLPSNVNVEDFLHFLGFTRENLAEASKKGYPPLLSYLKPDLSKAGIPENVTILDPMAGGGSIPLESAVLGVNTIACDYNPIAYLLLKATIEFPARYGSDLWKRLRIEVEKLSTFISQKLSPYYEAGVEGYIILREVKVKDKIIPLQEILPLSRNLYIKIGENGTPSFTRNVGNPMVKRELLPYWMNQHLEVMMGKSDLLDIVHRLIAVQTKEGFRLAEDRDHRLLGKAYTDYLSIIDSISLPKNIIPGDNIVFSEIIPLKYYHMLFNPRQSLALHYLISYTRNRVRELVEGEGEFGAALGLYLAFGVDRVADFNSIISTWNHNTLTIRDGAGSYYKYRKFRIEGNYAEAIVPYRTIEWVYEPYSMESTRGGIIPVVRELTEKLEGKNARINVYMCDVMRLSSYFKDIDIINVDPPYYDQHIYSDFSEFFWPLLKTIIEPAIPILFKGILFNWDPYSWRVPRSNEIIARKGSKDLFENRFKIALKEMREALKDNGVLILWFSHKNMEAWKTVAEALNEAQFSITSLIPLPSEHPTRSITKGGRTGLNRVLIIVARKKEYVKERNVEEILSKFKRYLRESKLYPEEVISEREIELLTKAATYALSKC